MCLVKDPAAGATAGRARATKVSWAASGTVYDRQGTDLWSLSPYGLTMFAPLNWEAWTPRGTSMLRPGTD